MERAAAAGFVMRDRQPLDRTLADLGVNINGRIEDPFPKSRADLGDYIAVNAISAVNERQKDAVGQVWVILGPHLPDQLDHWVQSSGGEILWLCGDDREISRRQSVKCNGSK